MGGGGGGGGETAYRCIREGVKNSEGVYVRGINIKHMWEKGTGAGTAYVDDRRRDPNQFSSAEVVRLLARIHVTGTPGARTL